METPNRWVIVEIETPNDKIQKVFAGWYGGYLDGDCWKLNSGIAEAKEDGDHWMFTGYSGNIYRCHKQGYGLTSYMASIYDSWVKQLPNDSTIKILESYD